MPISRLGGFLGGLQIFSGRVRHASANTAAGSVTAARVPGKRRAQTVMAFAAADLVMTVRPSHNQIELESLQTTWDAAELCLAENQDFKER